MHYGARWYSPEIGRFLSPDTIIPNPAEGKDFNRYSYVRNNPIRYNDPTGHVPAVGPRDDANTGDEYGGYKIETDRGLQYGLWQHELWGPVFVPFYMVDSEGAEQLLGEATNTLNQLFTGTTEELKKKGPSVTKVIRVLVSLLEMGLSEAVKYLERYKSDNIVFRGLLPEEVVSIAAGMGITRPLPYASTSPTRHVMGPKEVGDPWISTSRSLATAAWYASHLGNFSLPSNPIAVIDLNRVTPPNRVLDISTPTKARQNLTDQQAIFNATRDSEVLIYGYVEPAAIIAVLSLP